MSTEWLEGNRSPLLLPADVIHAINSINSIKTSEYELFHMRRFILIAKRLHWLLHVPSHKGISQPANTFMGLKTKLKIGQTSDHKKTNMCTQIPLDSWRNWLPLPHGLYNKKFLESFSPTPAFSIWIFKGTAVDSWNREVRKAEEKVVFFLWFKTNELVDPPMTGKGLKKKCP